MLSLTNCPRDFNLSPCKSDLQILSAHILAIYKVECVPRPDAFHGELQTLINKQNLISFKRVNSSRDTSHLIINSTIKTNARGQIYGSPHGAPRMHFNPILLFLENKTRPRDLASLDVAL